MRSTAYFDRDAVGGSGAMKIATDSPGAAAGQVASRSGKAASVFDLAGEVALVTGASSGLGRRFAAVLAANGAHVALAGRDQARLASAAEEIRSEGGRVEIVSFDLADSASVSPAFDSIETLLGPVSILVNNAGIPGPGTVAELSIERWRNILSVDLDAQFVVAQQAARRMGASRGGSIINVSSILGLAASRGDAAYSVAKAGLVQLSAVMALELAAHGIRVNTIAPGYVVTGMNAAYFASDESRAIIDRIPLGRVGQVDDLDGAILLLASRASRFMTGSVVVVDGGHVLSL